MQNGTKVKELSETGEIEIYDLVEDEEMDLESPDQLIEELGELNESERAILERMRGVKKAPQPPDPANLSLDGTPATNWITLSVGQNVELSGFRFSISHISQGFILLESDESPANEPETFESPASVWTQLKCTGARSLIRIDGTPFYVETRILTAVEERHEEENEEENSGGQDGA
jgi:hypothetical protein